MAEIRQNSSEKLIKMFDFIYSIILGSLKLLYKIFGAKKGYEPILPKAAYAPWTVNRDFSETFNLVKSKSLTDIYRAYEIWELVAETSKLSGAMLEVGVYKGATGAIIAKSAKLSGISNNVYLADTFSGVVKAGAKDSFYKGGEFSDTSTREVEELMDYLHLKNYKILKGIFPDETSALITDSEFRFCHIDVDVYQSAKDILEWLWPKLVIGGVIVFDDYGFSASDGVAKLVNEFRGTQKCIVVHNLNGHAVIVKHG